ncbi:DUF4158 domain-containing protein [Streptomyces rochei]|nr:DUF4158 domain-containing protein [Streptomyces rochei]WMI61338.1 DUF4158 domain-containing protein [Streptomyces rochei]
MAYEHTCEMRDAYEYHEHEDAEWSRRFRTFLHGWARTHAAGAGGAFHHAVGWLRRHRVPLPGVAVPARQVSESRKVADKRLHASLAGAGRRRGPPGRRSPARCSGWTRLHRQQPSRRRCAPTARP